MVRDENKLVTICIRKGQFDWIKDYRDRGHNFILSKFVRVKLDEFEEFVKEVENAKRIGRE